VLVTHDGTVLDGDMVLAYCARDQHERGLLRGGGVVATVMSNLGLEKALGDLGVELVRTQVGDRYVVEAMRAGGYNLGGEQSGHVIFLDYNTSGDGLITALQTLAIMRRSERTLAELTADFVRFPQVIVNVQVNEKKPIEGLPTFRKALERVEADLDGSGRVLIRYSGTEPKARIMVEGEDEDRVGGHAHDLADELQRALGGA
jgi:phosphoglucosamine mutase